MAVLTRSTVREGLDPPYMQSATSLHPFFSSWNPQPSHFLPGLQIPSTLLFTPRFPRPNYKREEMIFLFPRRLGIEIGV